MRKSLSISVVIPLYNKAEEIIATLESVLKQDRAADEVIIVDDGSTDSSFEVVSAYISCLASTQKDAINLVRQENQGVSAARNHGIELANGEYIAFLDADDVWLPQFLSQIEQLYFDGHSSEFLATAYQYQLGQLDYQAAKFRYGRNTDLENYFDMVAEGDLPFNASSVCIAKALLLKLGGFPLGQRMGEDQELWQRAALCGRIAYSPLRLSVYRLEADNRACAQKPETQECQYSQQLFDIARHDGLQDSLRGSLLACTATHLRHLAKLNIDAACFEQAKSLLIRSLERKFTFKSLFYLLLSHAFLSKQGLKAWFCKIDELRGTEKNSQLSQLRYKKRWRGSLDQLY
ncbi:glycosyltransferase family A protein [uncultured Pseudoteredinibacter sp.]|uniref:glycosyltransferase family 2 protein n=1 Tax=uncultured Pseudoteredinibacter sp. TaxID=1641701 RepID=UPI002623DB42|nr:glycosyltransferase family A protein [uncultured Pseudoteredinibacter sp.]